jgi:hypothetical protein
MLNIPGHKGNVNQNHLTPFRMGVIKKTTRKNFNRNVGKEGNLIYY